MNRRKRKFILASLAVIVLNLAVLQSNANSPHGGRTEGVDMLEAETLLSNLGYWIVKVDGVADSSTRHAIIAFQKIEGRKKNGSLNPADMEALRFAVAPLAKFHTAGAHVEIDITRQVLFLTESSGRVIRILPVSSGNEKRYFDKGEWQIAHTPRGQFRIVRKIKGVRKSTLGSLYYPNYFYGGVAIHGSNSVPAYPASHGCVRIPRFAERSFSAMVHIGMGVFVYD